MAEPAEIPWWLDEGEEQCAFCLQTYAYEVEVRCADCDRPSCLHCVVTVREHTSGHHCPECSAAPAAGDLEELSKSELYERAQRADLPGRGSMSKAELVRALRS